MNDFFVIFPKHVGDLEYKENYASLYRRHSTKLMSFETFYIIKTIEFPGDRSKEEMVMMVKMVDETKPILFCEIPCIPHFACITKSYLNELEAKHILRRVQ